MVERGSKASTAADRITDAFLEEMEYIIYELNPLAKRGFGRPQLERLKRLGVAINTMLEEHYLENSKPNNDPLILHDSLERKIELDPELNVIYSSGQPVLRLTPERSRVLQILVVNRGRIVEYKDVFRAAFPEESYGGRTSIRRVGSLVYGLKSDLEKVERLKGSVSIVKYIGYSFKV